MLMRKQDRNGNVIVCISKYLTCFIDYIEVIMVSYNYEGACE